MEKSQIVRKFLVLLDKTIECSYGTASTFGMHQAEEPREIEEFIESKNEDKRVNLAGRKI